MRTTRDQVVEAVMAELMPDALPVFEWGHETTPTEAEIRELAERIADRLEA